MRGIPVWIVRVNGEGFKLRGRYLPLLNRPNIRIALLRRIKDLAEQDHRRGDNHQDDDHEFHLTLPGGKDRFCNQPHTATGRRACPHNPVVLKKGCVR